MNSYLILKFIHVLSGAVLLGTGVGIAYFLLTAHLSRNLEAMRVVARYVILADWIFTATAVVVQPVSGVLMMLERGWPFTSSWFVATVVLYVAVGLCWIPVVVLQYRMVRMLREVANHAALSADYYRVFRLWMMLGILAFAMVLALYAVMIFKPGL